MNEREELNIADCAKCKTSKPAVERRYLGCGFEPPLEDRRRLTMWHPPPSLKFGFRGPELQTCAGYTTNLPEVRETQVARIHWEKGNLSAVLGGERPSQQLLDALVILNGEYSVVQRWAVTPEKDGGGAK